MSFFPAPRFVALAETLDSRDARTYDDARAVLDERDLREFNGNSVLLAREAGLLFPVISGYPTFLTM